MGDLLDIQSLLGDHAPGLKQRPTLADEAAAALRRLILLEKLPAGAPIAEREVAEALSISRTPLRQALHTLEMEGLVEYSASRRPRVANPSLEELGQNLNVLGALEGLAGELACAHATDDEIALIRSLNRRMTEGSDTMEPLAFFETDMEFHRTIVLASRNQPLIETHEHYNARLWRARFISSQRRPDREGTLRQHDQIAEALTDRKASRCAKALRKHLDTAITNIEKALAERRSPRRWNAPPRLRPDGVGRSESGYPRVECAAISWHRNTEKKVRPWPLHSPAKNMRIA